jgi:hypothetical protein
MFLIRLFDINGPVAFTNFLKKFCIHLTTAFSEATSLQLHFNFWCKPAEQQESSPASLPCLVGSSKDRTALDRGERRAGWFKQLAALAPSDVH